MRTKRYLLRIYFIIESDGVFACFAFQFQTLLGIVGVTNGPIMGVFCLGIFFKRTTTKVSFNIMIS